MDVIDKLALDPSVDETVVAVTAKDGFVSLTGTVSNHRRKGAVERAAQRVGGVAGIAQELERGRPSAIGEIVVIDADVTSKMRQGFASRCDVAPELGARDPSPTTET